jgi:hypothetical protein
MFGKQTLCQLSYPRMILIQLQRDLAKQSDRRGITGRWVVVHSRRAKFLEAAPIELG